MDGSGVCGSGGVCGCDFQCVVFRCARIWVGEEYVELLRQQPIRVRDWLIPDQRLTSSS